MKGFAQYLWRASIAIVVLLTSVGGSAIDASGQPPPGAPDPMFNNTTPVQVTMTESLEKSGTPPVVFAIEQLSMQGKEGYIYTRIVRPDLVPENLRDSINENLFFKDGQVIEQNLKDKSWVKYKCDRDLFVGYLNYVYTGAGILFAMAQYASQNAATLHPVESDHTLTFEHLDNLPDFGPLIKRISIRKEPPLQMREIAMYFTKTRDAAWSLQFSYDSKSLLDGAQDKPPFLIKEIPNPLNGRMVYP